MDSDRGRARPFARRRLTIQRSRVLPAAMPSPASTDEIPAIDVAWRYTPVFTVLPLYDFLPRRDHGAEFLDLFGPKRHERWTHGAASQADHRHQLFHDGDLVSLSPRAQRVERDDSIGHQPLQRRRCHRVTPASCSSSATCGDTLATLDVNARMPIE